MADICGPWTLEGLDNFGSIDELGFSLDDPIWESGDTCVLETSGDISAVGLSSAAISITYSLNGRVSANASVSALGYLFGEEWSDTADESNAWSEVPSQANIWTEQTSGNNSWQQVG